MSSPSLLSLCQWRSSVFQNKLTPTIMKTLIAALTLCASISGVSLAQPAAPSAAQIQSSIDRGLDFLLSRQDQDNGHWVTREDPALSALVLAALTRSPSHERAAATTRGYDFLLSNARPDGGIYSKARANYNTAICLMALVLRARPEDEEVIRRAARFVAGQQNDADTAGKTDNPFDGGIGYGGTQPGAPAHADLSNTTFALEALHAAKKLFQDSGKPMEKSEDLNWDAAITFISRCQNLKASNDQPWAGRDKSTTGAFGYTPVPQTPRGGKKAGGPTPMRCYGSISYAGMLSFIYAGLTPADPRVQAALEWLGSNYTVEENPGMGAEGLYYYYHTMAKALTTAGIQSLKTTHGSVNWASELSSKLLQLQKSDGSWVNTASGRWMESDPVLVTAYAVLSLQYIHQATAHP